MLVKIINDKLDNYGIEFKVRRMNYNEIIVNYPNEAGIKSFYFKDVELKGENDMDDFLINNRDFLKIKLKKGISVFFYSALYDSLKYEIKEEIEKLNVLRDKYRINNRGIWEKELLLTVNKKYPLGVIASGQNFKRDGYNIIINKIEKENFVKICYEEIENIQREIKLKSGVLSSFDEALEDIKNQGEISSNMDVELN